MRIIKQLSGLFATGYILMFYSEFVFWARLRPEDTWFSWCLTCLVYSLLGFVLLTIITRFHLCSIWALFLSGAVFGWLTEGVVVQTAYEALPLSISFTGLAWHALISVWVGWYAVRKALHTSARTTLLLASLIGLGYGFWAISWWVEPDGGIMPPSGFAQYVWLTTLLLIMAYWVDAQVGPTFLTPNRKVEITVAILFLLYFAFVTIPAAPIAVVILPVLLAIIYMAMRHYRESEALSTIPQTTHSTVGIGRYVSLLGLPLVATAFYGVAFAWGWRWQTNWVVYLITMPMGFLVLVVSLIRVWRIRPTIKPTER